ncbi:kinase-like protein, partial [Panus rudis PR-1116 ss-1]
LPRTLAIDDVECDTSLGPEFGGSFSDIYMGTHQGRKVALKLLRVFQNSKSSKNIRLKRNFCREALIWAHISKHEHVLPILGINETCFKHGMCMVLPWMENGNVLDFMEALKESGSGCTPVQASRWFAQIAKGLAFLHQEDIIHGDLRAANVLIDDNHGARVADFGLATVANDYFSQTSTIGRQPNWLAPEILDPNSKELPIPSKEADIYALGCVAFELYTTQPPYAGLGHWQIMNRVTNAKRPNRPKFHGEDYMPDALWTVVSNCMAHGPAARPAAIEVITAMDRLLSDTQES